MSLPHDVGPRAGKGPGSAGPVSIRDEALLVGILRNQEAIAAAIKGGKLPCPAPVQHSPENPRVFVDPNAPKREVEVLAEEWYGGKGPDTASPVSIRDEALLVAILRNQKELRDALGEAAGLETLEWGRAEDEAFTGCEVCACSLQ